MPAHRGIAARADGQITDAHGLPLLARQAPAAFGMTDLDVRSLFVGVNNPKYGDLRMLLCLWIAIS
jgi:hypothetical protein